MSSYWWYRPFLSAALLVAMIWLWSTRYDELSYHTWQSSPLIDIGDALSFADKRDAIPANSYVSVNGILGNKAATLSGLRAGSFRLGRYQVRHLLGSKLYIEYNEAKYHKDFPPFSRVGVKGRLIPFGPNSELEKVRAFFKDYYHQAVDDNAMIIVVDEEPRSEPIYAILFLVSIVVLLLSFYQTTKEIMQRRREV